jgi:DMSO reductase anchor subunit
MELQWPLILFTTFLAWAGGLFATQGVYALRGKAAKAQMPALITSLVLLIIGGIAVFFHLQHWERIFNGFGHITSGITQELIGIVVLAVVAVIYLVYMRKSEDGGTVPKWIAIVGIVVCALLVVFMGHSYLLPSRPAWGNVWQIVSLLGAAVALGPCTMAVIAEFAEKTDGADDLTGKLTFYGTLIALATTVIYIIVMATSASTLFDVGTYFDNVHPNLEKVDVTSISPFAGAVLPVTIVTIVTAVLAPIFAFLGKKKGNWKLWGTLALVCSVACAICLRVVFYEMGVTEFAYFRATL